LRDGIDWLDKHKTAAKLLAGVITTVLAAAVVDFAVGKVAKFVGGIKTMVEAAKVLAVRMGITAAAVETDNAAIAASSVAASDTVKAALITTGIGATHVILAAAAFELSQHWERDMAAIEKAAEAVANFVVDRLNEMIENVNEFTSAISFGLIPAIEKVGHLSQDEWAFAGRPSKKEEDENEREGWSPGKGGGAWVKQAQQMGGLSGNVSPRKFAETVLLSIGAPTGGSSRAALEAWMKQEGGNWNNDARFNPLNTTLDLPGARGINSVGVKAYTSWGQGLEATLKTLSGPKYHAVVEAIQSGASVKKVEELINASPWGTHFAGVGKAHTKAMEKHAAALEGKGTLPSHEKAKGPDTAAIDKWAEEHVGKFRESTGKNTGPELDALQKEFHTRAAAWCAEFATTAAMMGGANKAVRTASVATIREWAEAGTHGYKKGVGHTPHVGDLMMFGDSHVGFVQSVHGDKVTTIEGNTSGGKVEVIHRKAGEGTYATPIYRSGGAGSVIREGESGKINERIENAVKRAQERAEKLILTAAQRMGLHVGVQGAGEAHAMREHYGEAATSVGAFLQARQTKWALDKPDLTTAGGQSAARARDTQAVLTAQTQKKYYERELRAIRAEAKNWAKVRDSYLKLARHQHGGAKKDRKSVV